MTPASAQPATLSVVGPTRGDTSVNAPVALCASRMSVVNLCENAARFALNEAVRQNTSASPIQPSRSSRCGQSVGTLRKFPRCPHRMLLHNWFTVSFAGLELNGERRRRIEDDALNRIARRRSRISGQFNVTEAVKGEMRFVRFSSLYPAECRVSVASAVRRFSV